MNCMSPMNLIMSFICSIAFCSFLTVNVQSQSAIEGAKDNDQVPLDSQNEAEDTRTEEEKARDFAMGVFIQSLSINPPPPAVAEQPQQPRHKEIPLPAGNVIVQNCIHHEIEVRAYNSNDTVKWFAATKACVQPGGFKNVKCKTSNCSIIFGANCGGNEGYVGWKNLRGRFAAHRHKGALMEYGLLMETALQLNVIESDQPALTCAQVDQTIEKWFGN